jgi:eukaryotic-like serine/threonine-protein kinase
MTLRTDQLQALALAYERWKGADAEPIELGDAIRDELRAEAKQWGEEFALAFAAMVRQADRNDATTHVAGLASLPETYRSIAVHSVSQKRFAGSEKTLLAKDTLIGPYRLLEELGHGGMGVVWRAVRADGQHTRQVALKMPLAEHFGWALSTRFAREREILANLEHPSIARLYDAGVDVDGLPYIALEYIEGLPIDRYVETFHLDTHAILRLFVRVIDAVAYAHTQLVIHRDLKPSNILVDSDGQAHLLDFGIAKLIDGDALVAGEATELTRVAGRALTLDYAAPEQINGQALATATDVYSLASVLYQLLTGQTPHHGQGAMRRELETAILERDPLKPSERARRNRIGNGVGFVRRISDELDTVLLKALKKNPVERYATAHAFADDLRRIMNHQPIAAKPDRRWYRLAKFVRRNRLAMATAAVVAFTATAGAVATYWQALRAEQQAMRASQESERANQEAQRSRTEAQHANDAAEHARQQAERADREANAARNAEEYAARVARAAQRAELQTKEALRAAETSGREARESLIRSEATTALLRRVLSDAVGTTTTTQLLQAAEDIVAKKYSNDPALRSTLLYELAQIRQARDDRSSLKSLLEHARQTALIANNEAIVIASGCALASGRAREGARDAALADMDAAIERLNGSTVLRKSEAMVRCLTDRAALKRDLGLAPEETIRDAEWALSLLSPRASNVQTRAFLLSLVGSAEQLSRGFARSVATQRRALELLESSGEGEVQIASSIRLGIAVTYANAGQTKQALDAIRDPFQRARAEGKTMTAAAIISYAGELRKTGDVRASASLLEQVTKDLEQAGSTPLIAYAKLAAARTACEMLLARRCRELASEAGNLFDRVLPTGHLAHIGVLDVIGAADLSEGNYEQAVAQLLKATKSATGDSLAARTRTILPLTRLVEAQLAIGNLRHAAENAERSYAIAREALDGFEHSEWAGRALLAKAKVAHALGRASEARVYATLAADHLRAAVGDRASVFREAVAAAIGANPLCDRVPVAAVSSDCSRSLSRYAAPR